MKAFLPLLFLCAFALAANTSRGKTDKTDHSARASSSTFTVQWRNNHPIGYRIATFADFSSPLFANQYNLNNGFAYDTTGLFSGGCGLAVMEGFLKYPKNDTANSQEVTIHTSAGFTSCQADGAVGINGLVATMPSYGCGKYPDLVFQTPVSQTFFGDSFFTVASTCEFSQGENSFTLFISESVTPSTSLSPAASPYICCGYYDFYEHFESDFCQLAGKMCPEVDGYTAVGNYTAYSCDECCGTERKLFIQN